MNNMALPAMARQGCAAPLGYVFSMFSKLCGSSSIDYALLVLVLFSVERARYLGYVFIVSI